MSDQFNFEARLDFTSVGASERIQELGRISQEVESALEATSRLSPEFEALQTVVGRVQVEFQKANDEIRESGAATKDVEAAARGVTTSYADLEDALRNVSNGYKEVTEQATAAAAAQAGLNAAMLREMDPRVMTDSQLSAAKGMYDTSNLSHMQAVTQEWRRRQEAVREVEQSYQELSEANRKLGEAQDSLKFEKTISGLDREGQANARAADTLEKKSQAEERLRNLRSSGVVSTQQLTDATNEVTQATRDHEQAIKSQSSALEGSAQRYQQMRYQMYDVARSMAVVSGSLLGMGAGATMAFSSWESGMSNVYQTNMDKPASELARIEQGLQDVARTVPIAAGEIQQLAALAGQLEVTGDISRFTETMAMFGAISDTVSAEDAAESIAKLVNVMGGAETIQRLNDADDAYRAFATSIAQVGVSTAATDAEILHTASNLGIVGAQTNMAADEIIGLSAATASLGQPAERARSAFQDLVSVMNKGAAGGSVEQMEAMSRTLGMTRDEMLALWDANPTEFFMRFLDAVKQADAQGQNMTSTLNSFGIEGKRALPVFSALANNTDLVANSLEQAARGFSEAEDEASTFMQRFGHIADDLASMWQFLQTEVFLAAAAIGESFAPILKDILTTVGPIVEGFTNFIQTPVGETMLRWAVSLGAVVTVLALVVGAGAAAGASWIALRTTMTQTPFGRIIGGVLGINRAARDSKVRLDQLNASARVTNARLRGVGAAGVTAGRGLQTTGRGALGAAAGLRAFGRATIIIGVLQALMEVIFNFNNTMGAMANIAFWAARVLMNAFEAAGASAPAFAQALIVPIQSAAQVFGGAVNQIIGAYNAIASVLGMPLANPVDTSGIINSLGDLRVAAQSVDWSDLHAGLDMIEDKVNEWAGRGKYANQVDFGMGDTSEIDSYFADLGDLGEEIGDDIGNGIGKGVGGGAKQGAAQAKQELRTLVDYASDLQGVFSRAFDLRFQTVLSRDSIDSAFHDLAEAVQAAKDRVRDLRNEIRDLRAEMALTNASITQTEYFLSVALDYGDTMRAEQLQAELAKLEADRAKQQADLADKTRDLADAEDEASMSLVGSSKAAIGHRKTLTDLVQTYQDHLTALASSGMSQKELQREAQRLKKEFMQQAVAMGYSEKEVQKYARAFDDMGTIIEHVPRNVTIEFDGNPALTALREFFAELDDMYNDSPLGGGGGTGGNGGGLGNGGLGGLGGLEDTKNMDDYAAAIARAEAAMNRLREIRSRMDNVGSLLGDGATQPRKATPPAPEKNPGTKGLFDTLGEYARRVREVSEFTSNLLVRSVGTPEQRNAWREYGVNAGDGFIMSLLGSLNPLAGLLGGVGNAAGLEFDRRLKARGGPAGRGFSNEVQKAVRPVSNELGKIGNTSGNQFRNRLNSAVGSNLGTAMRNRARGGGQAFRNEFRKYGTQAGNQARNRARNALQNYNQYRAAGRAAGAAMKAGILSALHGSLGKVKVGAKATSPVSMGWAQGGYTGPGHKYQPAGIVHKGEYVIPKHLVNQRTGLPHLDSLGQLFRGSPSQTSFAAGGHARGNDTLYVEFTATAIRQLQRGLPVPVVNIGPDRVARAANAANFSAAKRGSN